MLGAKGEETLPPQCPERSGGEREVHVDEAAIYLASTNRYLPLTPEAEQKLVRKLDWILIPMLFLTATLGAVDKVALGTAALYGLREDLHLEGQQYAWAGSILPIGAIVGMWPSSYLMHYFPTAKYLCSCSIGWSSMALLMAACKQGRSLLALRFLMGALEAIIVPGISLLVAGFYRKEEQPPRNALVFAAISSVINGFLSWAVGHIPASAPLKIWQYLFLIVGSISLAWSIFVFIALPDSPMNAFFLSEEEKYHAITRLASNKTGIVNKRWKWQQAREAVIDPKTWLLFLFNISINIPNGGLITFGSIVINNLGFSPIESSLLNMPTGVMSTISAFAASAIAAKWIGRRCFVTILACCVPAIGSIIVYTLDRTNIAGQMVGLYFLYTYFGPYVVGISLAQANTAGHTKKNVQYSILYIGYAVGNLIGPQTFRESQAPEYTGGFIAMLVCYFTCILLMACYWLLAVYMNRRIRDEPDEYTENDVVDEDGSDNTRDLTGQFSDRTDFQQKGFRYTA
ncbi:hypothetical protein AJ80_06792 [Polytolypa hystricis UAMH7299]|uniref:Major facilitator superfamily (MFS) profile domain-containing protein n=1 Tax=Polytolypa hystricis (strain UAMH7299) TaxID=1447883 RepID=A0A2B7XUL5_POLH7|nr:hypothetical protein AJ80_06792 [Polytolypa hystricis UAMH7299]